MLLDFFVKGGVVMYPLLFCSLAALAVIVERLLFYLDLSRVERGQSERIKSFRRRLAADGRENAIKLLRTDDGPVARVLLAAASTADEREAARELRAAAETERRRLFAGLTILDTVVTAAPLLGLLGTVLGILHTFNVLGGGQATRSMEAVGRGIAEALITTATGLLIALPALVALNYFVRRAEKADETLEREVADWGGRDVPLLETQSQD